MKTGIYFLFLRKQLIYIGRTTNYPSRVKNHKDKIFDRMRFIPCSDKKLDEYERRLIRFFRPEQNINSKDIGVKNMIPVSTQLFNDIRSLADIEQRMFTRQIEYMLLTYIREKKKDLKYSNALKSA